jgi:putative membrane-bound dehydrogenase-like protein
MKPLAAVYLLLLPIVALAATQRGTGIQPLREFDLQLVAAGKWNPVAIDWDAHGKMWMAATAEDPLQPPRAAKTDSILVFDPSTPGLTRTFCRGLRPVGGFVFHRDGIIASEGSHIVFLRDRNADGVADSREILLSGFGSRREPAHVTSLRWGMDGWIYAVLGHGAEGCNTVVGKRSFGSIAGGIIRFTADGEAIETVSPFETETGTLDFTWDNELFFSRAQTPHVSHVGMPEKYFSFPGLSNAVSFRKIEDHQTLIPSPTRDPARFVQVSPGLPFSRASGAMIYEGGAWPERYHGNYYVCDSALRLIHEDVITRAESVHFEATRRLDGEFLTATMENFRPHGLRFGPDGAMYVLVSSVGVGVNPLIPARSPTFERPQLRPAGAVWRVQHKQARHLAPPDPARFASALEHPNGWVRRTALRLLIEQKDTAAVSTLDRLATSSRFAHARVAALWALHHFDALTPNIWTNTLEDIHPGVQRNAWLILAESDTPVTPAVEKIFNKQFKDADERVKLAMLLAMAKGPLTPGGRESITKLFPDLKDAWSKSVVLTVSRQSPMDSIKLAFSSDKSENYRELVAPLVEQLSSESDAVSRLLKLTTKHEKAEKLTATVKEVIARHHP